MELLAPGYWHGTYWPQSYWSNSYWLSSGIEYPLELILSESVEYDISLSESTEYDISLSKEGGGGV